MENFKKLIEENPLFAHIPKEQLPDLLKCLQAKTQTYKKGEILFAADQKISQLGIVLDGMVHTSSTNFLGDRSIISYMNPGQLFCDAYSSTTDSVLLVDIVAQTDCTVLLIETKRLLHTCAISQPYHAQMQENLIHLLAQKFVDLGCKVIHLSGRATRRKLLSYLSEQYRFSCGKPFALPFTQQELADYLFVERSGLSLEFNKLKKAGIVKEERGLISLVRPQEAED